MAIKYPVPRLTFQETCATLGLPACDLMRCVAEGLIVPMVFVDAKYPGHSVEDGPDGKPCWMPLCEERMSGCYYLVQRVQQGPAQCAWRGFSAERTADAGEMFYVFAEPYPSEHLPDKCYFADDEIARFRREHGLAGRAEEDKPLHAKERATAQKLIIGMAMGRYGYNPQASRSDIANLILRDIEMLGLALDIDTVRNWLKEAAKQLP